MTGWSKGRTEAALTASPTSTSSTCWSQAENYRARSDILSSLTGRPGGALLLLLLTMRGDLWRDREISSILIGQSIIGTFSAWKPTILMHKEPARSKQNTPSRGYFAFQSP